MSAYQTKIDVVNRALQLLRVDTITGFSDYSEPASEMGKIYERARQAELEEHFWIFAIRRSIVRPVDTTTVLWTPPTYSAATAYASAGLVTVDAGGEWWEAKQASTGKVQDDASVYWDHYIGPDSALPWVAGTYYTGDLVTSGGTVYRCLSMGVTSTPPSADWLNVLGTTAALQILYPIGAGPYRSTSTSNVYRLPHGYLRKAPTDPRAGTNPALGAPSANFADDHVYENGYYVSNDSGAAMLRYVGDMTDVPKFSPMFCEMLASRCAYEAGPMLVKDTALMKIILDYVDRQYKQERLRAVAVNAIVTEPVASWEDDYITCRY